MPLFGSSQPVTFAFLSVNRDGDFVTTAGRRYRDQYVRSPEGISAGRFFATTTAPSHSCLIGTLVRGVRLGALLQTTNDRKEIGQWAKTRRTRLAGAAKQAAGKVKEGLGNATGSKELELEGLAQEAKGKTELLRDDGAAAVKRSLNDHTISIVAAILILTVLVQIILVKSWT